MTDTGTPEGGASSDGIKITADSVTVMASEKVSTGDYETANVSVSIEASVEGVDMTGGIPSSLQERLYGIQRALQNSVKEAGATRRAESKESGRQTDR